jgi:hypothetical protein
VEHQAREVGGCGQRFLITSWQCMSVKRHHLVRGSMMGMKGLTPALQLAYQAYGKCGEGCWPARWEAHPGSAHHWQSQEILPLSPNHAHQRGGIHQSRCQHLQLRPRFPGDSIRRQAEHQWHGTSLAGTPSNHPAKLSLVRLPQTASSPPHQYRAYPYWLVWNGFGTGPESGCFSEVVCKPHPTRLGASCMNPRPTAR